MVPPIYPVCLAYEPLRLLLTGADGELKLYPFGLAPDADELTYPYATWQSIGGEPSNTLACRPDSDKWSIQVNVWGMKSSDVRAVVAQIRDAIEGVSYIVRWGNQSRDAETLAFGYDFDVDWFTHR